MYWYFNFCPNVKIISKLHPMVEVDLISQEPMFFSSDISFASSFGSVLTKAFLNELEPHLEKYSRFCKNNGLYPTIDTRSHMLMPGQYPAIPGWHCDNYPRKSYNSQPELKKNLQNVEHYTMFLSSVPEGIGGTEFVIKDLIIPVNSDEVWKSVNYFIDYKRNNILKDDILELKEGELVSFNQETIHRATAARKRGWRWWARLSASQNKPQNKIRKQVQVYTTLGGW